MSAAILSPKKFSPQDLDNYLARGWRPYGQQIYTADYIQLQLGEVHSVLPTRLNLATHRWRKGQRKLLRKNKNIFQFTIQVAQLTAAKIEINQRYKLLFPTKGAEDLNIHLQHEGQRLFNTQEVCIYHNEKLISFSFFDFGEQAIYSKVGIYDPDYEQYSLGIFSMYLEIEWCIANGLHYYYPGYISPETSLFDYKKKVGSLDFWSLQGNNWQPLTSFEKEKHSPLQIVQQRTALLFKTLKETNIEAKIYDYCFFELPLIYPGDALFLDSPQIIILHFPNTQQCWMARYKIEYDTFEFWLAFCQQKVTFSPPANRSIPIFQFVLQLQQSFIQTNNLEKFISEAKKIIGNKKQKIFL